MKKLLRLFDRAMDALAFLAGIILVFIMLSVCAEVVLRYFLNHPLIWVTQITECSLLYITFLGSAWLLREEGHVKVDILINRLNPKTIAFLSIISSIVGIAVSVILTVYGFKLSWIYLQEGAYTPTILEIPLFLIIVIIPLGSLMLLFQFVRRTVQSIAGFLVELSSSSL